jgi:hypothetical protein
MAPEAAKSLKKSRWRRQAFGPCKTLGRNPDHIIREQHVTLLVEVAAKGNMVNTGGDAIQLVCLECIVAGEPVSDLQSALPFVDS